MDLEIQIKYDVSYHIFIYATFVWPLMWKSWKGTNIHAKFIYVSKDVSGDIKRAKRDIHTYICTMYNVQCTMYILTY